MLPAILMGLTQLAPVIGRLIGGKRGEKNVKKVTDIVEAVTGGPLSSARVTLEQDPEKLNELVMNLNAFEIEVMELEVGANRDTNETMRVETGSEDKYVRRARPTFLYEIGATWSIQMLGLTFAVIYAICKFPADAPGILTALASIVMALIPLWTVALSVVGVYVKHRTNEKARALGHTPPHGLIAKLFGQDK